VQFVSGAGQPLNPCGCHPNGVASRPERGTKKMANAKLCVDKPFESLGGGIGLTGKQRGRRVVPVLAMLLSLATSSIALAGSASAAVNKYGNDIVTGVPSSVKVGSFDNGATDQTAEGVFFIVDGVRLFDEEEGTVVTSTTGNTATICTTPSGGKVDPYSFRSEGYYKTNVAVLYYSGEEPSGDPFDTVKWDSQDWHISGATNAHP
jgi:hypothetical protein